VNSSENSRAAAITWLSLASQRRRSSSQFSNARTRSSLASKLSSRSVVRSGRVATTDGATPGCSQPGSSQFSNSTDGAGHSVSVGRSMFTMNPLRDAGSSPPSASNAANPRWTVAWRGSVSSRRIHS
jgi:hypothetical protein